ncbi:MAG: MaoC family dehydratase [Candidatus Omnitrophica bacterium]|nr:MaoC family dehydratase [Candidatus Omnitrophota bacterium]
MKAADLSLADIHVGQIYQFTKKITSDEVLKFADLTGDLNPIHVDKEFGEKSQFKRNIVHGMFAGSLFSTLVGIYCPGKNALYLSQTLNFKLPIFYDDDIAVKGTVTAKNNVINIITLKTEIIKDGKVCINGEAKIKLIEAQK